MGKYDHTNKKELSSVMYGVKANSNRYPADIADYADGVLKSDFLPEYASHVLEVAAREVNTMELDGLFGGKLSGVEVVALRNVISKWLLSEANEALQ